MKRIAAFVLLAMIGTASASTSDDWTFDEWANWCGEAWEEVEEPKTAVESNWDQRRNQYWYRKHGVVYNSGRPYYQNPAPMYIPNTGYSPYGNYLPD